MKELRYQEDVNPESLLAIEAVQLIAAEEHAGVVKGRAAVRSS